MIAVGMFPSSVQNGEKEGGRVVAVSTIGRLTD